MFARFSFDSSDGMREGPSIVRSKSARLGIMGQVDKCLGSRRQESYGYDR